MQSFFSRFLMIVAIGLITFSDLSAQEFLVKDINPGPGWSSIDYKFRYGTQFYFTANSEAGFELWVSDGTPDGTLILKDIHPTLGLGSDPADFVQLNDLWYFTADDGANGRELWQTDGTEMGTQMVKDILPGAGGSNPQNLTLINGLLYFSANNGDTGHELWVSDGSSANTELIADINNGISSSNPDHFTALGDEIVFTATGTNPGNEIWKTDGTASGTQLIKDIFSGGESSFPGNLTRVDDKIYFLADDGTNGRELWRTDGTTSGTVFTNNIAAGGGNPLARDLYAVGEYLFMVADDGTGNTGEELYRSNANAAPAIEIVEIFVDTFGSTPIDFMYLGDDLLFNANNGINGFELWKASAEDGSVTMVKDIYPGFVSSSPVPLTVLNDELIFRARGENIGFELWKTDGTESGTVLVGDLNTDPNTDISSSDPNQPIVKDGILYFSATDHINGYQIWRTDGTTSTTQRLTSIPHDTIFNNSHKPYFINNISNTVINFVGLGDPYGEELWKVDVDPITITNVQTNSPLLCNGDETGTITVSISGGVGDPDCFTYQWSEAELSGLNASNLPAGSYTLMVTDCVGFTAITTIDIEEPDAVTGTATETAAVSCFGGSDGTAVVQASGGTGAYTFLWDNGQTGTAVSGLDAGEHSVTITDANNCEGVATVTITQASEISASFSVGATICAGASDGTVTINASGGTPPYTYSWDNGETGSTATALTSGSHTLTITDANGCTTIASVVIEAYPEIAISFGSQDVSCINGANGSATAQATGGTGAGYTYSWSNGATTATIDNLAAGTYEVTVTDNNGCNSNSSVIIVEPIASVAQTSAVSCFGGSDGSATVTISNANSTYLYLWDNGETSATATMLTAGTHTVTITDGQLCTDEQSVTITEATEFIFMDSIVVDPACFGEASGSISYVFSGGTTPYNYTWSTGATTNETLSGLSGNATYCATITDANNCKTFEFCSTLTEPAEISASITASGDATCFGTCDGSATVNASGGEYTFTWSSGETSTGTSSTAQNLCAGENNVTISDGTCSVVETVNIGQPSQIQAVVEVVDASCFGTADGSATVTASGGIGTNYTIEFSNGDSDLPAGNYFVVVTDETGCSIQQGFTVGQPAEIVVEFGINGPSCIGDNDASYTPFATGGTGPYTFSYNGDTSNLAAGTYYLTITDANNCTSIDSVTIADPAPINILATVTDISCSGEVDGSVNVIANGGTGAFSFEYSSDTTFNLAAGTYFVTATDANACVAVDSFTIVEPDPLEILVEDISGVSCFGASDGDVELLVSGGTPPYTFEDPSDLAAGEYIVTVTDANGCEDLVTFTVIQPGALMLEVSSTPATDNNADGTATIDTITGGTPPYAISWNTTPEQTGGTATGLTAGTYEATVSDGNGCVTTISVTVDMLVGFSELDQNLAFELMPNPAKDYVSVQLEFGEAADANLEITDVLGRVVYRQALENVRHENVVIELESLPTGAYWLSLRTEKGQFVRKLIIQK